MLYVDWATLFDTIPPELATALIAMIPIAELRAAIPVAIAAFDLPVWSAYLWAVIGNIIPAIFILLYLDPVAHWLSKRSRFFEKFFQWLFHRTREKFVNQSARYGVFIGLMLFVAIPLPVTGAWTGAAAAFLFGVPFRRALAAIITGVLIAGVIVSLMTVGITSIM